MILVTVRSVVLLDALMVNFDLDPFSLLADFGYWVILKDPD